MSEFKLDDRILVHIANSLPGCMCKGTVGGIRCVLRLHDRLPQEKYGDVDLGPEGGRWAWAEADVWMILDVKIERDEIRLIKVASFDLRHVGWTDQTYRLKLLEGEI